MAAAALLLGPTISAQNVLYTFSGDSAGDRLGWTVGGAGDVNRDGFDDLIVGAHRDDNHGTDSGSARVISGLDGSYLATFFGDSAGDFFGYSVAGAGDVNNDGSDDVIVGAPFDADNGTGAGSARVFSGRDGSILYTFYGDSAGDLFGVSVAGPGDVNQDGFADLFVGAEGDDATGSQSGRAQVFSGLDGSILYTFDGDSPDDRFGIFVSGAGDVNNDGSPDLIAGAFFDDNNGPESGSARVLSGADGSILYTFYGDSPGDRLGRPVGAAGDVNDDGFDDVIVGAQEDDNNGNMSGSARVLSGANGSILYTFHGDSAGDILGSSVAGIGDVNKDGHDDVLVGARRDDNNGGASGSARVLSGADGSILYMFDGDSPDDQFGYAVASAGDVNRDGYPDFIVGGIGDDNNGSESGSARVFSGLGCCPVTGLSCTTGPCESCPSMLATTTGGAPTLNNGSFALELQNAPSNMSYAILAISGPCVSPGTNYIFCGKINVPQPVAFLAAMPFTPGGSCNTNIHVPLPIPSDAAFLGIALGTQWAVSCGAAVLGTSISNCVSFVVTDS